MLNGYYLAKEAAAILSQRADREITLDDLRQMRRHKRIEGTSVAYNIVVYTQEQIDAATIPPERKPSERKKKRRKRTKSTKTEPIF